jgi:hypothetical protein
MEDACLDDLREELAVLENKEKRISAERRHLHRQMDFGFATETTRAWEQEVSSHRRELHRRIDALRERLGLPVGPQRPSPETNLEDLTGRELIQGLERIGEGPKRRLPESNRCTGFCRLARPTPQLRPHLQLSPNFKTTPRSAGGPKRPDRHSATCPLIRRGERTLHPRHWQAFLRL